MLDELIRALGAWVNAHGPAEPFTDADAEALGVERRKLAYGKTDTGEVVSATTHSLLAEAVGRLRLAMQYPPGSIDSQAQHDLAIEIIEAVVRGEASEDLLEAILNIEVLGWFATTPCSSRDIPRVRHRGPDIHHPDSVPAAGRPPSCPSRHWAAWTSPSRISAPGPPADPTRSIRRN